MKNALLLSTALLALVSSSACSTGPACGPDSCTGCCDANGECVAGFTPNSCGASGNRCDVCVGEQACFLGRCMSPAVSGGGDGTFDAGSTGGGGGGGGGGTVEVDAGTATGGGGGTIAMATLHVVLIGSGQGQVVVEGSASQTCTASCDETGAAGRSVTLTVKTPNVDSAFMGFVNCPRVDSTPGVCFVDPVSFTRSVQVRFDRVTGPVVSADVTKSTSANLMSNPVISARAGVGLVSALRGTSVTVGSSTVSGAVVTRFDSSGALLRVSAFDIGQGTLRDALLLSDGSVWFALTMGAGARPLGMTSQLAGGALVHLTAMDVVDLVVPLGASTVPEHLAVSSTGQLAVGGTVSGTFSPNAVVLTRMGNATFAGTDAFVLLCSATGVPSQGWRIGGRYDDKSASVAFDSTDRLLVATSMRDAATINGVVFDGGQFSSEGVVLRFNHGALDFTQRLDSQYETTLYGVASVGTQIAVVGNYEGTAGFGSLPIAPSFVGYDFVAMVDPATGISWVRHAEGAYNSQLATDGQTLFVGSSFESGGTWGAGSFIGDSFTERPMITRFSSTGTLLTSQAVLGGVMRPVVAMLGSTPVVGGLFFGPLSLRSGVQSDTMSADGYLAVLHF
jgi:hypothetical protein